MSRPDYAAPPEYLADEKQHRVILARAIKDVQAGKQNNILTNDVTLAANASSTIISDPRIGFYSYLGLMPLTANAAAALATTYFNPATITPVSGSAPAQAVIYHANNSQTDRTFRVLISG